MALAITTLACVARGGSGSSLSFAEESIGSSFPVSDICTFCDCSTSPPSYPASLLPARSPSSTADLGTFVRSRILATYCPHVYASDSVALDALHRSRRDPESLFAWNLQRLDPAKPTLYLFTKTSPDCSKTGIERVAYLKRHADTIARHRANVTTRGFFDGVKAEERQTIWIVVEDAELIHEGVADMLAAQDQPFIYFAFGPTKRYGNAQLNAALTLIHGLSNGMFGHGPVISADDDAEIHEDLLDLAWKVKKIGVWPMGNLSGSFEGPIWGEFGNIVDWRTSSTQERKYHLDNGAFTYPSSHLGTLIPGPAFWPTDSNGGESDFLERFVDGWDELEPICEQPNFCHLAWHDQPLDISHLWTSGIDYPF